MVNATCVNNNVIQGVKARNPGCCEPAVSILESVHID
eukprot:COSAG01_NODE_4134_length_5316_cov_6.930255_7_plen_37_part_00